MPSLTTGDADSAVRVIVTPSQSAYFAGEPFSVTITFTNTRLPEAGPSKSTNPRSHKRGAHSISSAPLAQPPTSPGTPRTPVTPIPSRTKIKEDAPKRKGLIGTNNTSSAQDQLPDLLEQRRKKQLAKSLSVSISPQELEYQVGESTLAKSAPYMQRSFPSPTTPHIPSPLTRTEFAISSHHPHARKHSVVDGDSSIGIAGPAIQSPYTPSSSTSNFSLALDPIAEATISPYPSTPSLTSPTIETPTTSNFVPPQSQSGNTNTVYAYPPPPRAMKRGPPPQIGIGHPGSGGGARQHPQTAFASTTFSQPNAELILYSYAQLTGSVVITPIAGALATPEQAQTLHAVRSALHKRAVVGGGSMDITSTLFQPPTSATKPRMNHRRSSSFSSSVLSLLSPSALTSPSSMSRWRMTSGFSSSPASSTFSNGSAYDEDIDPETPLPTFEVQPAMLTVDLALSPGESRTYTYTITLPDNLPPTFKGKSLKFSYELVVGICRAGTSQSGPSVSGVNSISRIMKVPIRLYNNVKVGQPLKPYDLLWPVARPKERASLDLHGKVVEERAKEREARKASHSIAPLSPTTGSYDELMDYASRLVDSLDVKSPGAHPLAESPLEEGVSPVEAMERTLAVEDARRREREQEKEDEGGLTGCREAVEIMTRNPKKISYDVNKDGVKVAVLTFTKSAYRLGETVTGIVELNERTSRARVLQVSTFLEAHETLPHAISTPTTSRHMRRTHAEHHSSFTLSTLRTTFTLNIPSDATPAFQVRLGTAQAGGGLEWKVRMCLFVGVAAETSAEGSEGVRFKSLVRDGPRGEWGSPWRAPTAVAPLEKPCAPPSVAGGGAGTKKGGGWASFFASTLLGTGEGEREYHDGDDISEGGGDGGGEEGGVEGYDGIKPDPAGGVGVGVDYGGGEEGWREVKLETVECEVPLKVWPGNTPFMATEVVFDV